MARKLRLEDEGGIYHAIDRGNLIMTPVLRYGYILLTFFFAQMCAGGNAESAIMRRFAGSDVQIVFVVTTQPEAERSNEIRKLTTAVAALERVVESLRGDIHAEEIVRRAIRRQHEIADNQIASWTELERAMDPGDVLCWYSVKGSQGMETGYALLRGDAIMHLMFVESTLPREQPVESSEGSAERSSKPDGPGALSPKTQKGQE